MPVRSSGQDLDNSYRSPHLLRCREGIGMSYKLMVQHKVSLAIFVGGRPPMIPIAYLRPNDHGHDPRTLNMLIVLLPNIILDI